MFRPVHRRLARRDLRPPGPGARLVWRSLVTAMPIRAAILAALAVLAACAPLPQLAALPPLEGGAPPALVPLETLLAGVGVATAPPSLAARAAALRARAALLRRQSATPAG